VGDVGRPFLGPDFRGVLGRGSWLVGSAVGRPHIRGVGRDGGRRGRGTAGGGGGGLRGLIRSGGLVTDGGGGCARLSGRVGGGGPEEEDGMGAGARGERA